MVSPDSRAIACPLSGRTVGRLRIGTGRAAAPKHDRVHSHAIVAPHPLTGADAIAGVGVGAAVAGDDETSAWRHRVVPMRLQPTDLLAPAARVRRSRNGKLLLARNCTGRAPAAHLCQRIASQFGQVVTLFSQASCALVTTAMVHSDNRLASIIALGLFATGVGAPMFLILAHDRPFTGAISIKPDPLLQVMPEIAS